MSSVRNVKKHSRRMPKVSYGRFIHVGLVGPKPRPKGVGDGQTVYIPLPLADDKVRVQDALGQAGRGDGVAASNRAGCLRVTEAGGSLRATKDDPVDPRRREKPHTGSRERPYRRPTLVGRSENSKANG